MGNKQIIHKEKSDPERLVTEAKGEITEEVFVGGQIGPFSRTYLSEDSVYELLEAGESIHYLLIGRLSGLVIDTNGSPDNRAIEPNGGYGCLAAITDRRVFFVVGSETGDTLVDRRATEIIDAAIEGSVLTPKVHITTKSALHTFAVKKKDSSDLEEAVAFVQNDLVPITESPEETANMDESVSETDSGETELSQPPDTSDDETTAFSGTDFAAADPADRKGRGKTGNIVFITDSAAVDPETRARLRRAEETIQKIDTSDEESADAIAALETAKTHLQEAKGNAGVSNAAVLNTVHRLDRDISGLKRVNKVSDEVRKTLRDDGDLESVSSKELRLLRARLEDGISAAEELDRSAEKLWEWLDEVETQLEATDGGASDEKDATDRQASSDSAADTQTESDEPTREDVLEALEDVWEELGKRPTTTDFGDHSTYTQSDVYAYFDSWDDAIDATSIETAPRQALLDELHGLKSELGFVPTSAQISDHGEFSTYAYRRQFDSVDTALDEAGLDLESAVRTCIRDAAARADGKPTMSDFGDEAPYSAGIVYKFFDSWDEAVETVATANRDRESGSGDSAVVQNELSERYELLRNLKRLCEAVVDGRDDRGYDGRDAMDEWVAAIESRWTGASTEAENYGEQQRERHSFSMQAYRRTFGDGDRVTEFEHVPTRPPTPTLRSLLGSLIDAELDNWYLPVDPETGAVFPVIVETTDELERAVRMLQELPERPSCADGSTGEKGTAGGAAAGTGDTDESATSGGDPIEELLEVNGVTERIATALSEAGYKTPDDLKATSMDELAAIDGISEQIAMRIKVDVGG